MKGARDRQHLPMLARLAIAATAGCISTAAAQGTRLDAPQLAARVNGGAFEFRGTASVGSGSYLEHHIWRFSPDGSVADVGTVGHPWEHGGYNEQPMPATRGTWKLNANQICIHLRENDGGRYSPVYHRFNGCYTVLTVSGHQVALVGPQILNGTIEPIAMSENGPVATVRPPEFSVEPSTPGCVFADPLAASGC